MRKTFKIFIFLLIVFTVFAISGCMASRDNEEEDNSNIENIEGTENGGTENGGTENGGTENQPIDNIADYDPNVQVEIEFWHAMGQTSVNLIGEIISNFNELYPNITVNERSLGDYDTLRETIISGISSDNLPTVAQTYPDHVALYLKRNVMRSLDDYIDSTKTITLAGGSVDIIGLSQDNQDLYIDGFFAEGKCYDLEGTLYSLPFNKSTEVMYYNKTIFDKYGWSAPQTWDDVVTIAEAYTYTVEYQNAINKGKIVAAFAADSEDNLFITLTKQWGGEYTKLDESGKGVYAFDNAESKAALAFFKENYDKGYFATATHFGADYSSEAFVAGNIIMTIGSSAGVSYNVPKDGSFEVGVCAYPQKDMNNPQVIQQGTNVSLFKCANPQEELAGWLFIKFLTNYESALLWCTETAYFPIRKDVLNSLKYIEHISGKMYDDRGNVIYKPNTQQLAQKIGLEQQTWFYTTVAFEGSSLARDEAKLIVQAILYGGKTIDRAYSEAIEALLYS